MDAGQSPQQLQSVESRVVSLATLVQLTAPNVVVSQAVVVAAPSQS